MTNSNLLGAPFTEDATELMLIMEPPSGIFAAEAFTIQNLFKYKLLVLYLLLRDALAPTGALGSQIYVCLSEAK